MAVAVSGSKKTVFIETYQECLKFVLPSIIVQLQCISEILRTYKYPIRRYVNNNFMKVILSVTAA